MPIISYASAPISHCSITLSLFLYMAHSRCSIHVFLIVFNKLSHFYRLRAFDCLIWLLNVPIIQLLFNFYYFIHRNPSTYSLAMLKIAINIIIMKQYCHMPCFCNKTINTLYCLQDKLINPTNTILSIFYIQKYHSNLMSGIQVPPNFVVINNFNNIFKLWPSWIINSS